MPAPPRLVTACPAAVVALIGYPALGAIFLGSGLWELLRDPAPDVDSVVSGVVAGITVCVMSTALTPRRLELWNDGRLRVRWVVRHQDIPVTDIQRIHCGNFWTVTIHWGGHRSQDIQIDHYRAWGGLMFELEQANPAILFD